MIRIKEISLEGVKNVTKGIVRFEKAGENLNTIGVYGANGTGKTALVDSIVFLQNTFLDSFPDKKYLTNMADILPDGVLEPARIGVKISGDLATYTYSVQIRKIDGMLKIYGENLKIRMNQKGARSKLIFNYQVKNDVNEMPFDWQYKHEAQRISDDENLKLGLLIRAAQVKEQGESFLFSDSIDEIQKKYSFFNNEIIEGIDLLRNWAKNTLVFSSKISGSIYANLKLPLGVALNEAHGFLGISIDKTGEINEVELAIAENIFKQVNAILPKIIPGLTVKIDATFKEKNKAGVNQYLTELSAMRYDEVYPLRMESDGIKKIISILGALSTTYNTENALMVVDELDAGINEFLLGEIIQAFASGAKGLLVFTSHNLRPLELLNYKNIVFTTLNPKNRYIIPRSIKSTNNLRDIYLRTIQLGGEKEELFEPVKSGDIRRALRLSGKVNRGEK